MSDAFSPDDQSVIARLTRVEADIRALRERIAELEQPTRLMLAAPKVRNGRATQS